MIHSVARVEPLTAEWAQALVEGDAEFSERFGVRVEDGWLVFHETRPALVAAAQCDKVDPWGLHLFFDDDETLVGIGGWKGPPVGGVAELGYAVAPARRGRGIATSVVRKLLARAQRAGLNVAVAHTLAQESASTAVLRRCGFTRVTELLDPDEGPVWRWEYGVQTAGKVPALSRLRAPRPGTER